MDTPMSGARGPRRRRALQIVGTLSVGALCSALLTATPGAAAQTTAVMQVANLTRPGGGVWLPATTSPGHFWVTDSVLGTCRVDPAPAASPPNQLSSCQGAAKSPAQAVYDSARRKLYVADSASKSVQVVRYDYNPAGEGTLSNPLAIQVPNVTAVGGGTGGGRVQSLALTADGTRLYVGYIKSGDVMLVSSPATLLAGQAPTIRRVGSTSDGRGTGGFTLFSWTDSSSVAHDDLFIAEIGGFGLSRISDVDGTGGRPACGSGTSICSASTVTTPGGAVVSTFPYGLANDGTLVYIGDAPPNLTSSVLELNPVTGQVDTIATAVTPSYTSTFDNLRHTSLQYTTGLALGPNGDIYVGDDPSFLLLTPVNAQGHLWKIPGTVLRPSISGIAPATGDAGGGTIVTITGTNLVNSVAGASSVTFGTTPATAVACTPDGLSCTATSPAAAGAGSVDVHVTNGDGQSSPAVPADQFAYTVAATLPGTPVVTAVAPSSGLSAGGTVVTITGTSLVNPDGSALISFGATPATSATCRPDGTSCTAVSPGGADGSTVDVQVRTLTGTSASSAADRFRFVTPVGSLLAYGITAPKGGLTWVPGALGGHYWISDHSNGMCRLDAVPGATVLAINYSACDPGFTIGSPGQVAYEPNANADGTHYLFVPDNAVRSPGVWRLTFDPATETVSAPVAMAPGLMDNLKTNSLAISADGHSLYVGDLVDGNIRRINGIDGDPRLQTVDIIAVTQAQKAGAASRGINGTIALLGNRLFLPENNAATYVDLSQPCAAVGTVTPCATTSLNFLPSPAAVFVAGVGADATHNLLYISSSPGGANATVFRFDVGTISAASPGGSAGVVYATGGTMPAAGTPDAVVRCSLTCTRPADPALTPGGTAGFQFAQGVYVDPTTSAVLVTEDATAGARAGRGHVWGLPFVP